MAARPSSPASTKRWLSDICSNADFQRIHSRGSIHRCLQCRKPPINPGTGRESKTNDRVAEHKRPSRTSAKHTETIQQDKAESVRPTAKEHPSARTVKLCDIDFHGHGSNNPSRLGESCLPNPSVGRLGLWRGLAFRLAKRTSSLRPSGEWPGFTLGQLKLRHFRLLSCLAS